MCWTGKDGKEGTTGITETETKRVLVAIPFTKWVDTDCWQSVLNLVRPSNTEIYINTFAKYSAAQARNIAAKTALEQGFDYILFTDSDQILPPDTLNKLLPIIEGGADVAVGWTLMNVGRPETNIAIYDAEKMNFGFYTSDQFPAEPFEADGCGFAAALIKTDMFKDLAYPYFVYTEYPSGDILSEDLYFSLKAREAGKRIMCDPSLKAGHIKRILI